MDMQGELTDIAAGLQIELKRATESILFAAEEPVTAAQIAATFSSVTGTDDFSASDVEETITALKSEYADTGRALRVKRWGGGIRRSTDSSMSHDVKASLPSTGW